MRRTPPSAWGTARNSNGMRWCATLPRDPTGNLILLTATPHAGVEHAFARLIGLLDPEFATFDLDHMRDAERDRLARHFVQRRRADVQR